MQEAPHDQSLMQSVGRNLLWNREGIFQHWVKAALCNFARYSALCRVHLCPCANLFFSCDFERVFGHKRHQNVYPQTLYAIQRCSCLFDCKHSKFNGEKYLFLWDEPSSREGQLISGGCFWDSGDYPTVNDLQNAVMLFQGIPSHHSETRHTARLFQKKKKIHSSYLNEENTHTGENQGSICQTTESSQAYVFKSIRCTHVTFQPGICKAE